MLKNFIFDSLEKILDILCDVDILRSHSDRLISRSIENIEMLENFIFESLEKILDIFCVDTLRSQSINIAIDKKYRNVEKFHIRIFGKNSRYSLQWILFVRVLID